MTTLQSLFRPSSCKAIVMAPRGRTIIPRPRGRVIILGPGGVLVIEAPKGVLVIMSPEGMLVILGPEGIVRNSTKSQDEETIGGHRRPYCFMAASWAITSPRSSDLSATLWNFGPWYLVRMACCLVVMVTSPVRRPASLATVGRSSALV